MPSHDLSSHYERFDRTRWSSLRGSVPLTLTEEDLEEIRGMNDRIDLDEVADVYLPLSRLLNLEVTATQRLAGVTDAFLGSQPDSIPFVIGMAGSVAVGKSTAARLIRALLAHWEDHPRVDLITTDGFLYPNAVLEQQGIMDRKGFPESYDTSRLLDFLREIKSGTARVEAPVYSHLTYDIIPDETIVIEQPDVLIVEGLNVFQTREGGDSRVMASDFFDFMIYIDADPALVEKWYVDRFLAFRDSVFSNPDSYFRHYADLSEEEATETASAIWKTINHPNLLDNIAPTRQRADLILTKGPKHIIEEILLRKS